MSDSPRNSRNLRFLRSYTNTQTYQSARQIPHNPQGQVRIFPRHTMSLSSRERRNPPTRRKSCHACIKAKRRCDFALPACMRCANRGISCEYPQRGPRGVVTPSIVEEQTVPLLPVDDFTLLDDVITTTATGQHCTLAELDFGLDPLSFSMDLTPQELPLVPVPSASAYGNAAVETIKRQLQYGLDETRRVPAMMANEVATPWSHHMLYRDGMPKSMRGKLTTCQPDGL